MICFKYEGLETRVFRKTFAVLGISAISFFFSWKSSFAENPVGSNVFSDWIVKCEHSVDSGKSTCQLYQSKTLDDDKETALIIAISALGEDNKNYGIISVPLGIYMAPGILIRVDKKRPFKVLYEICDVKSCHAGFKMSGPILSSLKRGNNADVYVYTSKKKATKFSISLKGFSKAYKYYLQMGNK